MEEQEVENVQNQDLQEDSNLLDLVLARRHRHSAQLRRRLGWILAPPLRGRETTLLTVGKKTTETLLALTETF